MFWKSEKELFQALPSSRIKKSSAWTQQATDAKATFINFTSRHILATDTCAAHQFHMEVTLLDLLLSLIILYVAYTAFFWTHLKLAREFSLTVDLSSYFCCRNHSLLMCLQLTNLRLSWDSFTSDNQFTDKWEIINCGRCHNIGIQVTQWNVTCWTVLVPLALGNGN